MINYRIRKRNTPIATLFKNYADKKSGKVSESRREIQRRFDCLDWIGWARERFGPEAKIVLNGISMGAATVLMAAGLGLPENVRGIIADCPFTSPGAIVKSVMAGMRIPERPFYPLLAAGARLFAGFGMEEADAAEAVKNTDIPILLIHGEDDRFVPAYMSEPMAAANPTLVTRITFPGAGHGMSYLVDTPRYQALTKAFINGCLACPQAVPVDTDDPKR